MSQHPSFKKGTKSTKKRNVLPRWERIKKLKRKGEWNDGDRVTGLKKTDPID